jgi:hypothetical protein
LNWRHPVFQTGALPLSYLAELSNKLRKNLLALWPLRDRFRRIFVEILVEMRRKTDADQRLCQFIASYATIGYGSSSRDWKSFGFVAGARQVGKSALLGHELSDLELTNKLAYPSGQREPNAEIFKRKILFFKALQALK